IPNGIRTRVTAVKGRGPRPLDDGDPVLPAPRRQAQLGSVEDVREHTSAKDQTPKRDRVGAVPPSSGQGTTRERIGAYRRSSDGRGPSRASKGAPPWPCSWMSITRSPRVRTPRRSPRPTKLTWPCRTSTVLAT